MFSGKMAPLAVLAARLVDVGAGVEGVLDGAGGAGAGGRRWPGAGFAGAAGEQGGGDHRGQGQADWGGHDALQCARPGREQGLPGGRASATKLQVK
ncbi:hypothetical protein LSPH26S_03815 [Lysinibacillus sphaericus]